MSTFGQHQETPVTFSMVNERAPGQSSTAPVPTPTMAQPEKSQGLQEISQIRPQPTVPAVSRPLQQAEFGKASPLRNPHKSNNIFNTNHRRPELHRPNSGSTNPANKLFLPGQNPSNPPYRAPSQSSSDASRQPPHLAPTSGSGFRLPGQKKRQEIQQSSPEAKLTADFFEQGVKVSKPQAPTFRNIPAAPRPMFSSLGPKTTFQPFVPPARNTIDLTQDDDDGFDPDAGLKDSSFGSVDPYAYIDPAKASENLKALLEGAFDDDQDKLKFRLAKRKKAAKKSDKPSTKALNTLERQLAALEVKDNSTDEASEGPKEEEQEEEDEEDGTVDGMAVKLLPHQVVGVRWMIGREIGAEEDDTKDKQNNKDQDLKEQSSRPARKKSPLIPKGGILADDMGLGKTIQSVSLILINQRPPIDSDASKKPNRKVPGPEVGRGTLVVAPLALIKQWEAEIKSKVEKSHALKVLVHHGPSRTKSHLELKKYDVVITTYQILASEHAGSSDHEQGLKVGCFGVHWFRVILDEAHSIKNRSAKSTQACYALRSWYRWCLTGTPLQNNLDELHSLIHFLQIKPYNELSHWKAHISGPMKNGRGHLAMRRLQYFLKTFMKRRTKDILKEEGALNFGSKSKDGEKKTGGMQIVERKIETVVCELDEGERIFYNKLAERANDRLADMMSGEKTDYIGALVLLLRLRQACNHPRLIESAMNSDKDALATAGIGGTQSPRKASAAPSNDIDDLADIFGGLGVSAKSCDVCQAKLDSDEVDSGAVRCKDCNKDLKQEKARKKEKKHKHRSEKQEVKKVIKSRARRIIHDSDDEADEGGGDWLVKDSDQNKAQLGRAGDTDDEDAEGGGRDLGVEDSDTGSEESDDDMQSRKRREHTDPTSVDSFISHDESSSSSESDDESAPDANTDIYSRDDASTKIRRLIHILNTETPNHKVIVFSQFTSMLDLIEPHLVHARIPYVRYDGSMRNDAREASLHSLRSDSATRVLLCSLKCGSLGLNLTAASRVVIVEPFWNPFVEEQAIDRVHRLNQTVDVKVYKLTVADTVEERILALQMKKRELANAAIEGAGKLGVGKLDMRDVLGLFGQNPDQYLNKSEETLALGPEKGELLRPVARKEERGTVAVASSAQNDRSRFLEKKKPRRSGEDPVYGRR